MFEKQSENEIPVYDKTVVQQGEHNGERFSSIKEACGFWRALWEKEGSGNMDAEWIEEIRSTVEDIVPDFSIENFEVDACVVGKIISGKRIWSAPGPNGITNFWWKKALVLHEGVAKSFQDTVHQAEFPLWFCGVKTTLIPKPGEFKS